MALGLPNINIAFTSTGITAIQRGERGVVALVIKDAAKLGYFEVQDETDIPKTLTAANKEQINLALMGGVNKPLKVVVYCLPDTATDYVDAISFLETVKFDYVAFPADITTPLTLSMAAWEKNCRDNLSKKFKAVLPNTTADSEGVINFATDNIKTATATYTAKQYCARIAGLLAGTPLHMSATFSVLPEVIDVPRLTKFQLDTAIGEGKFVIFHDGEKVKVARAVNSLQTTTDEKGDSFKKIKIVDILDLIFTDLKDTAEDNYIGKFANSYDNKCLLITAINGYYAQLVLDGLLDPNVTNEVFVDVIAQRAYLQSKGVNVSGMTTKEIKEANTDDKVFLGSSIKPLDAIEDITLGITI